MPTRLPECSALPWLSMVLLLAAGCLNAPVSGRKQFVAVPEQEEIRLGTEAWQQVLAREEPTQSTANQELIERVGRRIAAVAGRPDFQWEFRLLASEQINAFALPGGKVAVYEGILPICENEAGLAVVISHEIAHVLARHGGERMSQQAAVEVGGGLLGKAVGHQTDAQQERWLNAYGVASKYGVLLPYSRTHESEADSIGLTLMAQAGYDPAEAPRFWERFARHSGSRPPEFLSTHPSDAHRAEHLRSLLPRALAIYQAAPDKVGIGATIAGGGSGRARLDHGSGVQPAGFEFSAPPRTALQSSATTNEQFLPPIDRGRTSQSEAAQQQGTGAPPPFPTTGAPRPQADGWTAADDQ